MVDKQYLIFLISGIESLKSNAHVLRGEAGLAKSWEAEAPCSYSFGLHIKRTIELVLAAA